MKIWKMIIVTYLSYMSQFILENKKSSFDKMTHKKHFTVVFIIHFMFSKLFNKLDQTILNFLLSTLKLFPSINKIEFKD